MLSVLRIQEFRTKNLLEKYLIVPCGHTLEFYVQKVRNTLNSIINHMKVLLNSFHLNGRTLGFHPQTQKLEPPCTA